MNIYIKPETDYYYPTLYTLKIIEKNQNIHFDFVKSVDEADIFWDHTNPESQAIHLQFYSSLRLDNADLSQTSVFKAAPSVLDKNGKKDTIATIFYMVNCIQEINPKDDDLDQFGRYKFESSYQSRFNLIEKNIVQQEIDTFCNEHDIKGTKEKSTFFVSHDIDTIYGSIFQDGFWALKKMKLDVILKLIGLELIRKPHWRNIDKIIKIDSEYDVRSTFFWLVNNGKGTQNIMNADYNIHKEQDLIKLVNQSGFTNGLHKSCSEMSINEELEKGNLISNFNRYHFLNFAPHTDWTKISDSKIELDCSLGFAEHYGFRNSYGKAFQPFDIKNNKPYDFVEAPLNFMDGTFHKYMKISTNKISNIIINFFENNPSNCDFSLLWHNTYFTNYKYNSFIQEYKKVLAYIYENKIGYLTPNELIKQSKLEW
jgi:hypothetical protein